MPAYLLLEKIKSNRSFDAVLVFTFIVHVTFHTRFLVYKLKKNTDHDSTSIRQFLVKKFTKDALYRYLNLVIFIGCII